MSSLAMIGVTIIPKLAQAKPPLINQIQAQNNSNVMNLVKYLNKIGVKMYGAYWCPHCKHQKELFGAAASQLNYIECDPTGDNAQPQLCQKAQIKGYPTWEINGKLYPGQRTLQQLAELSGYKGPL
ncbi:thioredoxin domain-containing protein [Thermosynechococcaceae cyanobacterium BACA0444]|uniref:Thioredoxin domain-containing protein n=1 Tax=Pseudocalidococcus azoricus BACA0444 TaxID=2918990 RepID=A0AAE4FUX3_9CYAN|nr:thioredoxin domain-containing protein [Pseudocalidococcus azoricus]MDS3862012.1 thioredoxin domain-containing protein [Pseudocalidococcus azoricus BACA0444]